MSWLVLALGNPLAGADAFGSAVIARLRRDEIAHVPGVEIADAHTDLLGCLEHFPLFDEVVLIDTVLGDGPGVAVVDEEEFSRWDDRAVAVHQLSPVAAVKVFRSLHRRARTRVTLVAHHVPEEAFTTSPPEADIEAGVAAVRGLIGSLNPAAAHAR